MKNVIGWVNALNASATYARAVDVVLVIAALALPFYIWLA